MRAWIQGASGETLFIVTSEDVGYLSAAGMSPRSLSRRHERFYFEDGTVVLLVEDILYRIHRYFLNRDSAIFSAMFTLPCVVGGQEEGISDENPIDLKGQDQKEFDCFLSFFYPMNLFDEPKGRDLLIFLRVADKWQFDSQRQSALKRLHDRGTAAEKIATGREYEEAREWLVPAFMELCNREYPPDEEEGMLLGIKDLVLLWRIRFYMARVDYRSQDLSFEDYVKHVILHDGDPGAFPKRLSIPGANHFGPLYGGDF